LKKTADFRCSVLENEMETERLRKIFRQALPQGAAGTLPALRGWDD
jgi:hypothetical protein